VNTQTSNFIDHYNILQSGNLINTHQIFIDYYKILVQHITIT